MSLIQNLTLSDTSEKVIPCDWLLCSSDFGDIILIPCDLDKVDIDGQCTFERPTRPKSKMLISQRVNDDDATEKNRRRPLTWMIFGPCRRGIPHIQRAVFSSMTQRANHARPPLLHKNLMSDPWRSAGDLITVALEPWGVTSNPPSLDSKPDKRGLFITSKITMGYTIKKLELNRESEGKLILMRHHHVSKTWSSPQCHTDNQCHAH